MFGDQAVTERGPGEEVHGNGVRVGGLVQAGAQPFGDFEKLFGGSIEVVLFFVSRAALQCLHWRVVP